MKHYLAVDANIVHSSDFESGIVKVIDGNNDALSPTEFKKVSIFTEEVIHPSEDVPNNMTLAQKAIALKNKRRKINDDHHFINLEFIPPSWTTFQHRKTGSNWLSQINEPLYFWMRHVPQM